MNESADNNNYNYNYNKQRQTAHKKVRRNNNNNEKENNKHTKDTDTVRPTICVVLTSIVSPLLAPAHRAHRTVATFPVAPTQMPYLSLSLSACRGSS